MAAELNGTVKIIYDPRGAVARSMSTILSEWISSQNLIELEAWPMSSALGK
ncbi:hypothetical protein [Ensifer adhaerens]|uniref:hypothetical protein n=1 Tax=Ensifer adhaerens TaxID=106592 RepID=UPI001CF01AD6|nr:hypothetical protein [Ensifer adhaerens]UCM24484.1 hypothetical protein LDL63_32770 [Ensifer adhaerens]